MASSANNSGGPSVAEPFPIFLVAGRYTLYDVNAVSHARRVHNITGVLIGGLPQAPQQNVFLGIPLELMPEEARLLVEKGVAYIVDDAAAHKRTFLAEGGGGLAKEEKAKFVRSLKNQGSEATRMQAKSSEDRKVAALKKLATKNPVAAAKQQERLNAAAAAASASGSAESVAGDDNNDDTDSLFSASTPTEASSTPASSIMKITPTTSQPPLLTPSPSSSSLSPLPAVPTSYPLFKHLHSKGYFMSPGIRFGCRYTAYPGDPLRFHSHFLCDGMGWDEEFELLGLVGGGRLGTGVKKGFLVGGMEVADGGDDDGEGEEEGGDVRAFCIEWAGM